MCASTSYVRQSIVAKSYFLTILAIYFSLMHKRTKIIATVGPVTASREQLIALAERGVNVIRFNFSHADHTTAREIADRIHAINSQ